MRHLITGAACLAAVTLTATPATAKTIVYVSAAEDGIIERYALDQTTGKLTPLGKTQAGQLVMPMAFSPDHTLLYAALRSPPLSVLTYAINPADGSLDQKGSAPLPDSMAYVSTDRTGKLLFTASYGGDKIAVSPIDPDGVVRRPASQVLPTGRNAHSIISDRTNRFVYSANLGSDQVLQFRLDLTSGALVPNDPPLVRVELGNGPRHPVFSPDNRFIYFLSELSGNVIQFAIDPAKGTLTAIDYVGTVPADAGLVPGGARPALPPSTTSDANLDAQTDANKPKIWAADIAMTPDGRFVYTTERTRSRLALLSVEKQMGKLSYITNYPTQQQPRGIRIDPTGHFLIATGEKSDKIASFRIDQSTGALTQVDTASVGKDANWVEITDLP